MGVEEAGLPSCYRQQMSSISAEVRGVTGSTGSVSLGHVNWGDNVRITLVRSKLWRHYRTVRVQPSTRKSVVVTLNFISYGFDEV